MRHNHGWSYFAFSQ